MTTFLRGGAEEQLRAVKAADVTTFTDYEKTEGNSCKPKTMQVWYVLDLVWISSWLEFVFDGSQEPGPVSNWRLLDDDYSIRTELELKRHYRVVGAGVWKLLYSKYFGGGPPISFTGTDALKDPSKWIVDRNSVSFASALWSNPKRLRNFSKVGMLKPGSIDGELSGPNHSVCSAGGALSDAASSTATGAVPPTGVENDVGALDPNASGSQCDVKIQPCAEERYSDVVSLSIQLEPHVHTLLCDRMEKVCTAMGKFRERETLSIVATLANGTVIKPPGRCVWYRKKLDSIFQTCQETEISAKTTGDDDSKTEEEDTDSWVIIRGEKQPLGQGFAPSVSPQYIIRAEDAGYCIRGAFIPLFEDGSQGDAIFSESVGPMEAAPPKAIALNIIGECRCDSILRASLSYWGGTQGHSEYWWIRIRNGRRENICDPTPVPDPAIPLLDIVDPLDFEKLQGDPRYLVLGQDDVGCTFKAKCRPIRNDGARGEVATSKACEVCLEGESHV